MLTHSPLKNSLGCLPAPSSRTNTPFPSVLAFFSPPVFSSSIQESSSPDRDSRALFNTVFSDSHSELVHVSIPPTARPYLTLLSCPCHRCHNLPIQLPPLCSFNRAGNPSLLLLHLPVAISILLDTCLMTHLLHHPPLLLPFHPLP